MEKPCKAANLKQILKPTRLRAEERRKIRNAEPVKPAVKKATSKQKGLISV